MEPIEKSLKSERQIAIARLQDAAMDSVLAVENGIILHGGTAIWRCFGSKRFSFDLDVYATDKQLKKMLGNLTLELNKRGITMDYPISTGQVIDLHNDMVSVKLEILKKPKGKKSVQKEYAKTDGTKMFVNTLSEEDFITEKIKAYKSRGYARDLYDMYFLVSLSGKLSHEIKGKLSTFLKIVTRPEDEKQLKELVYDGVAPTFDTMVNYIKGAIV